MSFGDGEFEGIPLMNSVEEVYTYWLIWYFSLFILNIVFLNFIVAELTNTYTEVSSSLIPLQQYGKAEMVSEIEMMFPDNYKNNKLFPKYIIIRDVDNWKL